jgi:hypothetical protein
MEYGFPMVFVSRYRAFSQCLSVVSSPSMPIMLFADDTNMQDHVQQSENVISDAFVKLV